jgi:hypothetical protein
MLLEEVLLEIKNAHFDADGALCSYRSLARSQEHARLGECLAELERFDPKRVRIPAQTAFWVNVFNAAVLRDCRDLEGASSVRQVEAFFERSRLNIGGLRYSLDDIEHGLLRGNVGNDPRLAYMPIAYDERVHFAMYSASHSSPSFRVFDGGMLDEQFEQATCEYLQRTVRVENGGALIILPRQLYWYRADFGGERGALEFALSRLDDDTVEMVDRRQGRVKLRYAPFDWALNKKST